MNTGDLRRLLAHRGPFATVQLSAEHRDQPWQADLTRKGAPARTVSALDEAVRTSDEANRLLVAVGAEVLLDRRLAGPSPRLVTRVGALPYLVPLFACRRVPHAVARVGESAAEVRATDGETTIRRTVPRATAATELTDLVDQVRARLLVASGDLTELWDALPDRCREILVEPSSPRDADVDFDRIVASLVTERATTDDYALVDRFLAELATGGRAVQGLADTTAALNAGTAATVVIADPAIGDAALWTSTDPTAVALTEAELPASGAAGAAKTRADEALPAAAVSTGAELVSAAHVRGEPVALTDGVGALLTVSPRRPGVLPQA